MTNKLYYVQLFSHQLFLTLNINVLFQRNFIMNKLSKSSFTHVLCFGNKKLNRQSIAINCHLSGTDLKM